MKRTVQSFGYAISGLAHAILHEENLRKFMIAEVLFCIAGVLFSLSRGEWFGLLSSGVIFIVAELLNTALERIADTLDDLEKKRNAGHYHPGIKTTKDVAASASLIALLFHSCALLLIFLPRIIALLQSIL